MIKNGTENAVEFHHKFIKFFEVMGKIKKKVWLQVI